MSGFYEVRRADGTLEGGVWNTPDRRGLSWESVSCGACKPPCVCDGYEVCVIVRTVYPQGGGCSSPAWPILTTKTKRGAVALAARVRAWLRGLTPDERAWLRADEYKAREAFVAAFADRTGLRHARGGRPNFMRARKPAPASGAPERGGIPPLCPACGANPVPSDANAKKGDPMRCTNGGHIWRRA